MPVYRTGGAAKYNSPVVISDQPADVVRVILIGPGHRIGSGGMTIVYVPERLARQRAGVV